MKIDKITCEGGDLVAVNESSDFIGFGFNAAGDPFVLGAKITGTGPGGGFVFDENHQPMMVKGNNAPAIIIDSNERVKITPAPGVENNFEFDGNAFPRMISSNGHYFGFDVEGNLLVNLASGGKLFIVGDLPTSDPNEAGRVFLDGLNLCRSAG